MPAGDPTDARCEHRVGATAEKNRTRIEDTKTRKPQLSRLRSNRIHDVRLHRADTGGADIIEVCAAHSFAVAGVELIVRAAIAAAKYGRPPCLRRRDRVFAGFGNNLGPLNASLAKQLAQRRRITDAIPGIEALVEVGPHLANRVPEGRCGGLEEVRAPGRDGELAARADDMPQRANRGRHIGREEDAEDADNGIKARRWQLQIEHVSQAELDILQSSSARFGACQREKIPGEVDAENGAVEVDLLGGNERGSTAPAANVENVFAGPQAKSFDRPATEASPEGVRGIVVSISRSVVGRARFAFGVVGRGHTYRGSVKDS